MTGLEALQSVQYVTVKGKRFVVLDAEDWEALVEWLETLEDLEIAREALVALRSAKGIEKRRGGFHGKKLGESWREVQGLCASASVERDQAFTGEYASAGKASHRWAE